MHVAVGEAARQRFGWRDSERGLHARCFSDSGHSATWCKTDQGRQSQRKTAPATRDAASRFVETLLALDVIERVHALTARPDLEVHMRSRGKPRGTHQTYSGTRSDHLPGAYVERLEMPVVGHVSLTVVQDDDQAARRLLSVLAGRGDNRTPGCCENRSADRRCQVHSGVDPQLPGRRVTYFCLVP